MSDNRGNRKKNMVDTENGQKSKMEKYIKMKKKQQKKQKNECSDYGGK